MFGNGNKIVFDYYDSINKQEKKEKIEISLERKRKWIVNILIILQ